MNTDANTPARDESLQPLVDDVADWLVAQALGDQTVEVIFEGCCHRLYAAGVPLSRAHVSFRTLHPLFSAVGVTWTATEALQTSEFRHGEDQRSDWLASPFWFLLNREIPRLRRRLTGPAAMLDFPILIEFRDRGATDYMAYAIPYGGAQRYRPSSRRDGIIGSWTTDAASGFSDEHLQILTRVENNLALVCKIKGRDQIVRNILSAYLGHGAGEKVLNGRIRRGDMESIHSVIWLSDMRDSTRLAESMPPERFIESLNRYFDATAGAVQQCGGEVLRFPGDAVLAIFPVDRSGRSLTAFENAMAATREAMRRIRDLNSRRTEGEAELRMGLALHVGDVQFGNIGIPERLEFTVIGPAANETARIESLTRELGCTIIASDQFANRVREPWRPLGSFSLRGVGAVHTLYALDLDEDDSAVS